MNNLKVGDKIMDIEMSRRFNKRLTPVITEINKKRMRFVCDDTSFINNSYPHSFYRFEKGIKWDYLET